VETYGRTKQKGDLGVLKAQVDLFEQGLIKAVWLECDLEGKSTQEWSAEEHQVRG
jgi:hypothetical protein